MLICVYELVLVFLYDSHLDSDWLRNPVNKTTKQKLRYFIA